MAKTDGLYIAIVFNLPITSTIAECPTAAFTITTQEYTFVPGGVLQNKQYTVSAIAAHPSVDNAIRLAFAPGEGSIRNAASDITVAYNSAVGNLAGTGGPVESFSVAFTPSDLLAKPDVNDPENIEITSIQVTGILSLIVYHNAYNGGEYIEIAGILATGTLTHVDDL